MIKYGKRALLACLGAIAIVSCSAHSSRGVLPSSGTAPAARTTVASAVSTAERAKSVRPLCGLAKPGFARCFALLRTDVRYEASPEYRAVRGVAERDLATDALGGRYGPLGPVQLQQAYNLPSATAGKGQTVGIIDAYSDPTAETDLAVYRKQFKLPPCTIKSGCLRILNQEGKTAPLPPPDGGWAGEISLDLDMVSAICPNCHIVLVEANSERAHDLTGSVRIAAAAGAAQISNSYGLAECNVRCQRPDYASDYDIPNTIITASSGDSTWFAGPQAPADFDTVVAVGGTSLYPFDSSRGWLEVAWTGAGSSCSKYIGRPTWVRTPVSCPGRMRSIADVAAVADPYTGVLVFETYPNKKSYFYIFGGTSASSPIIAGVYALAGNAASQTFGSLLYAAPKGALTDVTIGRNGWAGLLNAAGQVCKPVAICTAMPGYDGPTGMGTPWGLGAF
jgi:subtilase family serine protease